jgi:uncharacterized repeat protein (TIGR01451 family)
MNSLHCSATSVGVLGWMFFAVLGGGPAGGALAADTNLFSVSSRDGIIRILEPSNGATLAAKRLALSGHTIVSAHGLAIQPSTATMWGILGIDGTQNRHLVTIDPATGAVTDLGTLDSGRRFAGITFASDGTLYGVTGGGGTDAHTLFTISTNDASTTLVCELFLANFGQAIAFHPSDPGLLYHGTGDGLPEQIFETVDPNSCASNNIPLSGDTNLICEVFAYVPEMSDSFLFSDFCNNFGRITTNGVVTILGPMDHDAKGLAFAEAELTFVDLAITKSTDTGKKPFKKGSTINYHITVSNVGSTTASGVVLTDNLPGGVAFASATSGCGESGGVVTCALGTLAAGTSTNVTITGTVTVGGKNTLLNEAEVASDDWDSNPGNNTATISSRVVGKQ